MKPKSIIFSLLLFTLYSFQIFGQQKANAQFHPPPIKERINKSIEVMNSTLKLSDNQEKEIRILLNGFFADIDKLMQGSQKPDKTKMDEIIKKRDNEINKILTESQQKLFESNKDKIFPKPPPPIKE